MNNLKMQWHVLIYKIFCTTVGTKITQMWNFGYCVLGLFVFTAIANFPSVIVASAAMQGFFEYIMTGMSLQI